MASDLVHAQCMHYVQNGAMPVTITIRSVPDEVRDALAARAKRQGKSLQEYLSGELRQLAGTLTVEEWMDEVRATRAKYPKVDLSAHEIVDLIHDEHEKRTDHLIAMIEERDDAAEQEGV